MLAYLLMVRQVLVRLLQCRVEVWKKNQKNQRIEDYNLEFLIIYLR